ncbi:RNA methyltransferase [Haloferula helveola]|uniref:RNA methyltransferase n=1 Tax=Haloferula helveola TaxID=490095 RepID=A0ABM7RFX4_9BACT|nr:RNA methyltransferase [Haloferula helveola]
MDELLADRVRVLLTGLPGLSEKRMFGGLCFLVNGNMACGVTNKDEVMLRVGPERYRELLAKHEAREMDFTGRPMKGFLFIDPDGMDVEELAAWLEPAVDFASSLPAK